MIDWKKEVSAVKILAKRLDEVALVVDALVAKRLVAVAEVNTDEEPLRLENVPVVLFRLVIVAVAAVKLEVDATVAERSEIVVVARLDVPVTVSVDVARNVPATRLVVVA